MFDAIGAFTRQFTPIEGGYLFYSTRKGGGKRITADEYQTLVDGWRKVAGLSGTLKAVGVIMLAICLWVWASQSLSLPAWSDSIDIAAIVIGMCAWFIWAALAPRRLVRDRPAITPPRPMSEMRRQARSLLHWRFIIFALLASAVTFLGSLHATPRNFTSWAWLVGSGVMFGLYAFAAVLKFRDR